MIFIKISLAWFLITTFSGIFISGEEDEFSKIGEERMDWQKSAFPLPWTDSPDVVEPQS